MLAVSLDKKRQVKATEKREQRRNQRSQKALQWKVNSHANHQKHFRVSRHLAYVTEFQSWFANLFLQDELLGTAA